MKQGKEIYGIGLILLILVSLVKADDVDSKLIEQLTSTLNGFAQKHQLSDTKMESLLGELVLHDRKMKKGGVGVIDKETFLALGEKQNTIVIGGKKWRGKNSDQSEVVLMDGYKILGSGDNLDIKRLKIVVFSPTEVRYIDLSNNTGGTYIR